MPDINLGTARTTAIFDATQFRAGVKSATAALRDLRKQSSTLSLTIKLAGNAGSQLRKEIDSLAGRALPITVRFNSSSAISQLKADLAAIPSLNTNTLTGLQVNIASQIRELRALIAQLSALGPRGGSGGGAGAGTGGVSASTAQLLQQLDRINNAYARGETSAAAYTTQLEGLRTRLQGVAASSAVNTAEFQKADAALTRLQRGLQGVKSDGIERLRQQLVSAKEAFERVAASADTLAAKRSAQAAYNTELQRLATTLTAVRAAGQLTAQQLTSVNQLLRDVHSQGQRVQSLNFGGINTFVQGLGRLGLYVPVVGNLTAGFTGLSPAVALAAASISAFAAGFANVFRTAAEFQQVVVDIRALTQPLQADLQELTGSFADIGQPLGVGMRDAALAALELNRAGLTVKETIGGGLAGALTLAGAAAIDTAEAARLSAGAMTGFGLVAADSSRIADNFANFANQTFLGARDLSMGIAAVGPVALKAGLSLEEFGGIMVALAKGGFRRMTDAGTSLKVSLQNLMAPSGQAYDALTYLGVSAYGADGKLKPFLSTLEEIKVKLKDLSPEEQGAVLRGIFGSDGIRAANILLGKTKEELQALIDVQGKQGEAARVASDRLDSYKGSVDKLKAAFEAFKIALGEKFLPTAQKVVEAITDIFTGGEKLKNTMEELAPFVAAAAAVFINLNKAAIAAALSTAGFNIAFTLGGIAGAVTTAAAAVGALTLGLAAVAVASVAAVAYVIDLKNDIDEINAAVQRAGDERAADTQRRVNELRATGDEADRAKAKVLSLQQQLIDAQMGDVTGKTIFGEEIRSIDEKKVADLKEQLAGARSEFEQFAKSAGKDGKQLASDTTEVGSPESLKKLIDARKAAEELREALDGRPMAIKLIGADQVTQELKRVSDYYDTLREKAQAAYGSKPEDLKKANAEIAAQQAAEEAKVREVAAAEKSKQLKAEREKDAKAAAKIARDTATAARNAEIAAMQDGAAKVQAQRDQELQQLRDNLNEQLSQIKGNAVLKAQAEEDGRRIIAAKQQEWAAEDAQRAKEVAQQVADAQGETRQLVISAIQDEDQRRAAQRNEELRQLQADTQKKVDALAGQNDAQLALVEDYQKRIAAKQVLWAQEDAQRAKETARRIIRAQSEAQDAEFDSQQASRDLQLATFDASLKQRLNLVKGNEEEVARLTLQGAKDRAAIEAQVSAETLKNDRRKLDEKLAEDLSAEQLTADERTAVLKAYRADVDALDRKYRSDEVNRVQQVRDAEVEAQESIRKARFKAAQRPADQAAQQVKDLERAAQLKQSTFSLLTLESQREQGLRRQAATYAAVLKAADQLNLTEEERKQTAEQLADAQQGVTMSLEKQRDLGKQVLTEARELLDLYEALSVTGFPESTTAMDRFGAATRNVADSFGRALPFLERFRAGRITPDDFEPARESLQGLVTDLKSQQDALAALRGEYDRQRSSLNDLYDSLQQFGAKTQDENLLNVGLDFKQAKLDTSVRSLDALLKSGTATAEQLSTATKQVFSDYEALSGAVKDVTDLQASKIDSEIERTKKAQEARLRSIDAQIKAAKDRGQDTKELEEARQRQAESDEAAIRGLESRKAKLEADAQVSIKARTEGVPALMERTQVAASGAAAAVDELGQSLKSADQQAKQSADLVRDSLKGAFDAIPDYAALSGRRAAEAFVQAFQLGDPINATLTIPAQQVTQFNLSGITVVSNDPDAMLQQLKQKCARSSGQSAAANAIGGQ